MVISKIDTDDVEGEMSGKEIDNSCRYRNIDEYAVDLKSTDSFSFSVYTYLII